MSATVTQAATHFQVHRTTVCGWIRAGCPCVEVGSVGRSHGSLLDLDAVTRWLTKQKLPTLVAQDKTDALNILATALYDLLKRDGLMGQMLPAEQLALLAYERAYRNLHASPLQFQDLPNELKRVCSIYVSSVEKGHFLRR